MAAIDIPGLQTERIRNLQRRDADLSDTIAYLEDKTLPAKGSSARALLLCVDNYFLDKDGILCHIWVPNKRHPRGMYTQLVVPAALRQEVLTAGHDDPTAGHLGTHKTYEKLRRRYYWRGLYQDVDHWCRSCVDCAMKKRPSHNNHAPLLPIPVDGAFYRVAVHCLGPFRLPILVTVTSWFSPTITRHGRKRLLYPPLMLQLLLGCWWIRSCVGTVPHVLCCRTVAATSSPSWSRKCAE